METKNGTHESGHAMGRIFHGSAFSGSAFGGSPISGAAREVVLASPDLHFRGRVRQTLEAMRWRVREARGGADALYQLSAAPCKALLLDSWLPDLEIEEFIADFRRLHPRVELIQADEPCAVPVAHPLPMQTLAAGAESVTAARGGTASGRNELLFALRSGRDAGAILTGAGTATQKARMEHGVGERRLNDYPVSGYAVNEHQVGEHRLGECRVGEIGDFVEDAGAKLPRDGPRAETDGNTPRVEAATFRPLPGGSHGPAPRFRVKELIGCHPLILEVSRRIRLAAPHRSAVLIQGATGTGKELVAKALHRLSRRSEKPFVALNCSAIPEALLEAELFGHARGAFTGAVQRRAGRIEGAAGGTLLLDEIGELPLSMQAKLLRFVESGELQRVGENGTVRVDVRIVAATHRPLAQLSREGRFREDLYYRLAVFLIQTPPLSAHREDIALLASHFLSAHFAAGSFQYPGQSAPRTLTRASLEKLQAHSWPGSVRELEHVLERASILAEDGAAIDAPQIEFAEDPLGG